jgi:S1-C subfamily serine protease
MTSKRLTYLFILPLLFCLFFGLRASEQSIGKAIKEIKTNGYLEGYYRNLRSTVVGITANKASNSTTGGYYGTGTVISAQGHILTSTTVVPDDSFKDIVVFLNNFQKKKAEVVYTDKRYEISIIKISGKVGGMNYASFADSDKVEMGDRVFTAGNAFSAIQQNDEAVLSAGIVSSRYKAFSTTYRDPRAEYDPRWRNIPRLPVYSGSMIEITAASNGGGDGGGVYDDRGQIIGLLSLNFEKIRELGLCVPISTVKKQILKALEGKEEQAALLKTLKQKPSSKSLLKEEPLRLALKYQAKKIFPVLAALEVTRTSDTEGGDKARNPYMGGNAKRPGIWRIPKGQCSGFYIDAAGHILTSYFNISGQVSDIHTFDVLGNKIKCTVLGYDQSKDLALLSTGKTVTDFVTFNKEDVLSAGQSVAFVGMACNGQEMSLTTGTVSATGRWYGSCYQTDAKSNKGINGSLLLDIKGQVQGIANHVDGRASWHINSGVGFATNVRHILASLEKMKKGEKNSVGQRGFMGVRLLPEDRGRGLAVSPQPGKAAARAGLKEGDRLIEFEGKAIKGPNDLFVILQGKNAGDKVSFKILRAKKEMAFSLTLESATGKAPVKKDPKPKPKPETSDADKLLEKALKKTEEILKAQGFEGETLKKMMEALREKMSKDFKKKKKDNGSSLPESFRSSSQVVLFLDPVQDMVEKHLEEAKKSFEAQGFFGEKLEKLLNQTRLNLRQQIKEKKLIAEAPKHKAAEKKALLEHCLIEVKKDFEAQGFHGEQLKSMLAEIRKKLEVKIKAGPGTVGHRAYLGVSLKEVAEGEGVSVLAQKGKAAARAGILDGDRIMQLNDFEIKSPDDLVKALQTFSPGDIVAVVLKRKQKKKHITLALDGPGGPVQSTKEQLASKFNNDPINRMVDNVLPAIKKQLSAQGISGDTFKKIVAKAAVQIRAEIEKRLEADE